METVRVWARIGVLVDIPKDLYKKLDERRHTSGLIDASLTEEEANYFIRHGKAEGNSYVPGEIFERISENNRKEQYEK